MAELTPSYFKTPSDFRKWLEKNHAKKTELLVGFYKVGSGKKSMTWSESVDQALCFGWIDGVRKSIDENSYTIRFTPRKPNSIWSAVNVKKVEELSAQGLMHEAGMKSFQFLNEKKSKVYTHEIGEVKLSPAYEKLFKKNKKAWAYFNALAPGYYKLSVNWIMSAKQETTQLKRLEIMIQDSELGTNQWKDNKYKKK